MYLWISNEQNEFDILGIYRWWGWHLWSHLLSSHALTHTLLAFAFCSTCLQCTTLCVRLHTEPDRYRSGNLGSMLSKAHSYVRQTCSCSLCLCGSLEPSTEGIRTPEKAECRSLLHTMRYHVRARGRRDCAGERNCTNLPDARRELSGQVDACILLQCGISFRLVSSLCQCEL